MASRGEAKQLLTVPQVADQLNLSVRTIWRRIHDGELPAVRLGRGPQAPVRINPDDLERYILEGTTDGQRLPGRRLIAASARRAPLEDA